MSTRLLPLALLLSLPCSAETALAKPKKTSLCALVKDPHRFADVTVQLRAQVSRAGEAIVLSDGHCLARVLLDWPEHRPEVAQSAYVGKSGPTKWSDHPSPASVVENDAHADLLAYLDLDRPQFRDSSDPGHQIFATLTGRFETAGTRVLKYRSGETATLDQAGFGPNRQFALRLVLNSVADVIATTPISTLSAADRGRRRPTSSSAATQTAPAKVPGIRLPSGGGRRGPVLRFP